MEEKQTKQDSLQVSVTTHQSLNTSGQPQQEQHSGISTSSIKLKSTSLQNTLKEILGGVRNKPSANQSALLDRLALEFSSVASLNNPNSISYSRDKSFTTDTTLSNNKLFLPRGIVPSEVADVSHDHTIGGIHSSSSYEDCESSSSCSCVDCQEQKEIDAQAASKQAENQPPKLKEEEHEQEEANLTNNQIREQGKLLQNQTDQKINEMSDDVFGELVAYSYLAGLATAQLQKADGTPLSKDEVDLNDTQFIERSLLQYENWQQSFLNNTVVHEAIGSNQGEEHDMNSTFIFDSEAATQIEQEKLIVEAEVRQIQQQATHLEVEHQKETTPLSESAHLDQVNKIIFQEYYKQLIDPSGIKKDKLTKKQSGVLGEHLYDVLSKQRANGLLDNLDGKVTEVEVDENEEPLPPFEQVGDLVRQREQNQEQKTEEAITLHQLHQPTVFETSASMLRASELTAQMNPIQYIKDKQAQMEQSFSQFEASKLGGYSNEEEIRELVRDLEQDLIKKNVQPSAVDEKNDFSNISAIDKDSSVQEQDMMAKDCICGQKEGTDMLDQEQLFMDRKDLKMMLDVEKNLYKMLQYSSEDDQQAAMADSEGDDEPYRPNVIDVETIAGMSLKQLETFMIQGDLRRCVVCNTSYNETDTQKPVNLPRVLFCGDCICEQCIVKHTQKASMVAGQKNQGAACQLICPVCNYKHIFNLTKSGFLVANDNYIKFLDDKGPVNFFPGSKITEETSLKMLTDNLRNSDGSLMLMDPSISIPNNLVLRSLPINVELLELLRGTRDCGEPNQCNGKLRGLFHLVLDENDKSQEKTTTSVEKKDRGSSVDREAKAAKEAQDELNIVIGDLSNLDKVQPFKIEPEIEKSISEVEALYPNKRDKKGWDKEKEERDQRYQKLDWMLANGVSYEDLDTGKKVYLPDEQQARKEIESSWKEPKKPKKEHIADDNNISQVLKSLAQSSFQLPVQSHDVVKNIADWFLQSKQPILNKGNNQESDESEVSGDSDTNPLPGDEGDAENSEGDGKHNIMPGKRKRGNSYKTHSSSSKSTFKHAGGHHINSAIVSSLSSTGPNINSLPEEIGASQTATQRKRKLRERRKLRQQQQNNSNLQKKIPLFTAGEESILFANSQTNSFLIDNQDGNMSPDSAEDVFPEYSYGKEEESKTESVIFDGKDDPFGSINDLANMDPLSASYLVKRQRESSQDDSYSNQARALDERQDELLAMLRSGQGYPQEPKSSQLPHDHDEMSWSKANGSTENDPKPPTVSVNDLLAHSLQGLQTFENTPDQEKRFQTNEAMRDLSRAFNDTKGEKYGVKKNEKGTTNLKYFMEGYSNYDKKKLLHGFGKDTGFQEYLGKQFGVNPDLLQKEWKKFEIEAEILSEAKVAAQQNPDLAKYRPSDEALREMGLQPEELPFSALAQNPTETVEDTLSDSANKKKARRNKKKRKKQQITDTTEMTQLQQTGTKISSSDQNDMLTNLVLQGEETIEADELRYRTVAKDYFNYKPLSNEHCAPEVFLAFDGQYSNLPTVCNVKHNQLKSKTSLLDVSNDLLKLNSQILLEDNIEQTAFSQLKMTLTCIFCCEGAPVLSVNKNTEIKSAMFGKQDCQLIKEMVEVGITTVATHVCITCSLDRSQSFWASLPGTTGQNTDREQNIQYKADDQEKLVPEWVHNSDTDLKTEASQYACNLCLMCSIRHKQLHGGMSASTAYMHEQNGGLKEDLPLEQHKMQALIPLSHFQLIQKQSGKGPATFNALVDDRARAYFSQATDEEYSLYITSLNKELKIFEHDQPVYAGGIHFAANKDLELEPLPAAQSVQESTSEKKKKIKKKNKRHQ